MIKQLLQTLLFCIGLVWQPVIASETPLVVLTTFSEAPMRALLENVSAQYPDIKVRVIYRRIGPAARLVKQAEIQPVDVVLSSSAAFFHQLEQTQLLAPLPGHKPVPSWLERHKLTHSNKTLVLGYSGVGIMNNRHYLNKHQLPVPKRWEDLALPAFSGHIMMSTPTNSGTTHMMVENILQQYGWQAGWALLKEIGGNLASISARSFGVSDAISRGLVGAGLVIDSYAINAQEKFEFIDFHYLPDSVILPTYLSVTASSQQKPQTHTLINYLLSGEGQKLLDTSAMAKMPLNNAALAENTHYVTDAGLLFRRDLIVKALFDLSITYQLPKLQLAWKLIHQAEAMESLSVEARQQVTLARKYASQAPISADEALADQLQPMFSEVLGRPNNRPETKRLMYQWRQQSAVELDRAISLAKQAMQQIP